MNFVHCRHDAHAVEILDILNHAIVHSTALYDYKPRPPESMAKWFDAKETGRFPVIGVEADDGRLLGFATYGAFRAWPAYKYSVENSVYVQRDNRGRGIGRALMKALIDRAVEQEYHTMVAGIDVTNSASIAMHRKLGFLHAGTIREVGFKFGRWLDLAFYQLTLKTPSHPADG